MSHRRQEIMQSPEADMYYYLSTALLGFGMIMYPFIRGAVIFNVIDVDTVMIVIGALHGSYAMSQYHKLKRQEAMRSTKAVSVCEEEVVNEASECSTVQEHYAIHIMDNKCSKQPLKVDVYELTPIHKRIDKESVYDLLPIRNQFETEHINRVQH